MNQLLSQTLIQKELHIFMYQKQVFLYHFCGKDRSLAYEAKILGKKWNFKVIFSTLERELC